MKLSIKLTSNDLKKTKGISLVFPNGIINTKVFWRILLKYINKENHDNIKATRKIISKFYKTIKKYVKTNGHFTLLELDSESAYIKVII